MMDIVSSTQSGDVIIEPKLKALTKDQMKLTLKIEGEALIGTEKMTLSNEAVTLDLFSNTAKSSHFKP